MIAGRNSLRRYVWILQEEVGKGFMKAVGLNRAHILCPYGRSQRAEIGRHIIHNEL